MAIRMVRKQVYIQPEHEALLKRRAKELRVTEAELIRRGIERLNIAATPTTHITQSTQSTRGPIPGDLQAWADAKAFIQRHRKLAVPQTGRTWTRDGLYDDRLRSISG